MLFYLEVSDNCTGQSAFWCPVREGDVHILEGWTVSFQVLCVHGYCCYYYYFSEHALEGYSCHFACLSVGMGYLDGH